MFQNYYLDILCQYKYKTPPTSNLNMKRINGRKEKLSFFFISFIIEYAIK